MRCRCASFRRPPQAHEALEERLACALRDRHVRLQGLSAVLNAQKRRCRSLWESTTEAVPEAPTQSLEQCLERPVPVAWSARGHGGRQHLDHEF